MSQNRDYQRTYTQLEMLRQRAEFQIGMRDNFTPYQQSLMLMLHNCDVMGCGWNNILILAHKSALWSLSRRGIITDRFRLSTAGNDIVAKWMTETYE